MLCFPFFFYVLLNEGLLVLLLLRDLSVTWKHSRNYFDTIVYKSQRFYE